MWGYAAKSKASTSITVTLFFLKMVLTASKENPVSVQKARHVKAKLQKSKSALASGMIVPIAASLPLS